MTTAARQISFTRNWLARKAHGPLFVKRRAAA